jgi:hypothetical protein
MRAGINSSVSRTRKTHYPHRFSGGIKQPVVIAGAYSNNLSGRVFLAGGNSGMILDCILAKCNPSDSGMFLELMRRQGQLFERVPCQVKGFKQYLWSALLTYNLTVVVRSRMQTT